VNGHFHRALVQAELAGGTGPGHGIFCQKKENQPAPPHPDRFKKLVERRLGMEQDWLMTQKEIEPATVASVEEIQQGWQELQTRVGQLEAERSALEHENKALRFLLERIIEHRQKSHGELVLLLTGLVSKLPINDVGVIVSKLVEHNAHVSEVCTALVKGKAEASLPHRRFLKALNQTKQRPGGRR